MAIKFKENKKLATWHIANMQFERSVGQSVAINAELAGWLNGNPNTINFKDLKNELETLLNGAPGLPTIKQVIYNEPATIILWNDGTKTVVKCTEGDTYDAEKGFLLAYLKKMHGNDNTFKKLLKQHVPEETEETAEMEFTINFDGPTFAETVTAAFGGITEKFKNPYIRRFYEIAPEEPEQPKAAWPKENPHINKDYSSGPFADMYKKFIDVK